MNVGSQKDQKKTEATHPDLLVVLHVRELLGAAGPLAWHDHQGKVAVDATKKMDSWLVQRGSGMHWERQISKALEATAVFSKVRKCVRCTEGIQFSRLPCFHFQPATIRSLTNGIKHIVHLQHCAVWDSTIIHHEKCYCTMILYSSMRFNASCAYAIDSGADLWA